MTAISNINKSELLSQIKKDIKNDFQKQISQHKKQISASLNPVTVNFSALKRTQKKEIKNLEWKV